MKILSGAAYGVRRIAKSSKISSIKNAVRLTPYALLLAVFLVTPLYAATGEKAMVVTPDLRATQAALKVLEKGGNAVDAAVAAQWMLQVVQPESSGIGGGGLLLFYDVGTRSIMFFDGSVKAPAKASPEMFLGPQGNLLPYRPDRNTGGMPVGVPGLLKLTEEVHAKYGTHKFQFSELFEPAILLAEEGIEVSESLAEALRDNADRFALLDPPKEIFFKQGVPLKEGEELFQSELAKTFQLIQAEGSKAFYKGAIAKAIEQAVRKKKSYRPGRLERRDLADYEIAVREAVHATYQSYDLFSAGPPADGGVMLFRSLNILSNFGIPSLGQSPETYHLLGETQKAAFSNRFGVADPDLFDIPLKELLSEAWSQDRANGIQFDKIIKPSEVFEKKQEKGQRRAGSSIMVVDPYGNIVILAATLGDEFGSALRVPGYGFFLNDQLADLAANPGVIKDSGSAELISGSQRPRGREAPLFAFKEGKPAFLLSAYGPDDPAAVLLNIMVQKIDLGASCAEALESPRLLARDGILGMESGLYEQEMIRLKLDLLGHKTEKKIQAGFAQMVCFEGGSGRMQGENDPRGVGEAAGF